MPPGIAMASPDGTPARADAMLSASVSSGVGAELIPRDRPVYGRDLPIVRQVCNWDQNTTDAAFGIPRRTAWYQITSKRQNEPVKDYAYAVLVRLYLEVPETRPSQELDPFDYLAKAQIELTELASMTGRKPAAAHYWASHSALPRPIIRIVQALMRAGVTHRDHPIFQHLTSLAKAEYEARGEQMPEQMPKRRQAGATRDLVRVEKSLLTQVDD